MKMLSYEFFDDPLILNEQSHYSIVIENPIEFRRFISNLKNQIENKDDFLIYSINNNPTALPDCILVSDPFSLSLKDKKITNALVKKIDQSYKQVNRDGYFKFIVQLEELMETMTDLIDLETDYSSEITIANILKLVDLHIAEESDTYLNLILNFVKSWSELSGIDLFFFVNLNSVLSSNELALLYKELDLLKIDLINITFTDSLPHLPCEKLIIIDKDLCQIDLNF